MKFRKKPVVVEAWRVPMGRDETTRELPAWLVAAVVNDTVQMVESMGKLPGKAYIKTLEGVMTAQEGDWIIQGVKGELYPCKPDIFAATYEPA